MHKIKRSQLTKKDISKKISSTVGFSKSYSIDIIDNFIEILIMSIKKNETNIKNFGIFKIIKKKERIGRNPKNKENFVINARNSVSFIMSKTLKKNMNNY